MTVKFLHLTTGLSRLSTAVCTAVRPDHFGYRGIMAVSSLQHSSQERGTVMIIGIPKEIKDHEYRVSLTPEGAATLRQSGHEVWLEPSAGQGSGFSDDEYRKAGALIARSKNEVFEKADMIVKVKEPLLSECPLFRPGQVLFTYLHLAALPELTKALLDMKLTAVARETIEAKDGSLPMLKPMSEIAGRMSVQIGAQYLEK